MIADYAGRLKRPQLVQWDEPIAPTRTPPYSPSWRSIPASTSTGWAAATWAKTSGPPTSPCPRPSTLRSAAKETTLKASIVYSGRQHANEVSSTSHILKLGEQLVNDPETRAALKKVNVVLHPITNTDGAELSVQLAEITPNNMLHPGYHGALAADVSVGQTDLDPVYPESRTRRQLLEAVAARRVPESARLSVARMGAAVFRILRLGDQPPGREQRTHLVDPARMVHQPDLPARRHASVQSEDRLRNPRPDRGGGARRPRTARSGEPHERALSTLRPALAAGKYAAAASSTASAFTWR